jgi:ABC-type dipeptide/oligopeptide/nickel transport system permease component
MTMAAHNLEKALDSAFDVDLNTINIQKFNQYLQKTGLNIKDLQADLALAGTSGQQAFINMTASLLKFGTAVKQSNKFLDKMAETMGNTVKWGITSSIFNNIVGSVQKAYYYMLIIFRYQDCTILIQ